jgi:hypothetical protein
MNILKTFFMKNGKFKPVRYLITIISHLVIITVIMRLCNVEHIDNGLVGIMTGLVSVLIGADTWRTKSKEGSK